MRMSFFSICRTRLDAGYVLRVSVAHDKIFDTPKNVAGNNSFELLLSGEGSSGPRAMPCRGAAEQLPDFLILRRRKVMVPLADSEEWNRSHRTHDMVHFITQFFAGGFRGHGHSRNDLLRSSLA